ncbi:MAG: hypothetical protein K0R14_371 [Burkholderiales bacterium]|jgi:hypothetical protein|nr:hypothetical protein [Burkholderiales bacterium]
MSIMQKIKDNRLLDILVLNWKEALPKISAVNPGLAECMQKHSNLLKDLPFFIVNYPFGEKIINNREVFFPLAGGGGISFNDPSLPDILRDNLSYTPGVDNPVGMILDKESEFFRPIDGRIVSYQVVNTGQIIGFAHIIDTIMNKHLGKVKKATVSIWNLLAGARSAFVLPKISENGRHANLQKTYGINVEKPNSYTEHSDIFRALNAEISPQWIQPILYFPKQLSHNLKVDQEYLPIFHEMASIHRLGYSIWHNAYPKFESDINYVFQKAKVNGFSAYAVNIVKHLYLIIANGAPGFAPTTNENMLPKKLVEDAYTDKNSYGLTDYWPTIMQPKQFDNEESVYYSLGVPSLIHYNPETFKGKTSIALLSEVADVLARCQEYILNEFEDKDSSLYEAAIKARFSFYHDDPNPKKNGSAIKNSALLPKEDPRFCKKGWEFPFRSSFVRGCIKIEPIKK